MHVERSVELIDRLAQKLVARGWTVANDSPLAVLCLVPPAGTAHSRPIVERVLASGRAWVAAAMFEGREIIRACATHGKASPDDVDELVDALEIAAAANP